MPDEIYIEITPRIWHLKPCLWRYPAIHPPPDWYKLNEIMVVWLFFQLHIHWYPDRIKKNPA